MTTDQKIRKLGTIAKDMQTAMESLVKLHHQAVETSTDIYRGLEKPDCLFSESPVSPNRLTNSMRMYLSKMGWAWAHSAPWAILEEGQAKPFAQDIKENAEWARRFAKDSMDKIV